MLSLSVKHTFHASAHDALMETIGDRIASRRKELELSQADIARTCDVSKQAVGQWEADKTVPTGPNLVDLAEALTVTERWLATGKQPKLRDRGSYLLASRPAKNLSDSPSVQEIDVLGGMGAGGVPALEYNRSDGLNIISADPIRGEWKFPPGYLASELRLKPSQLRVIEVTGDSMEPTLRPGDRVMVDLSHRIPTPLGIYALWDGLGVIVKRLEYLGGDPPVIAVTSDNPEHERRKMTADEVNIIGRVVWFARRL